MVSENKQLNLVKEPSNLTSQGLMNIRSQLRCQLECLKNPVPGLATNSIRIQLESLVVRTQLAEVVDSEFLKSHPQEDLE